jgi:MFS family permease
MTASVAPALSQPAREQIYRRNFVFFLTDNILFTVAMGIMGSTTVIPDFVRHLTDSEILIGLSGSLFSIGFALPQLFVARHLVRHARKKWWFVGPNIPVRFVMLSFAGLTVWLGQNRPGLILLAFFLCLGTAALGDGLVGVPWSDLAGTSLDGRWRARMLGLTNASTGVIMLLLAPLIGLVLSERGPDFPNNYAILFGAAGGLFVLSILPGIFLHELPGAKAAATIPPFREFLPDLGRVLRDDAPFRAFVITRMFATLFVMAAPFYIGYATVQLGEASQVAVPLLLAMQTVGSIAGALVFTWLGARNNVFYIRLALACGALLPLCALLAGTVGPLPLYLGFLVAGLATGSNLGFALLNWLVTYTSPDQRPTYVGLANTTIAVVSLCAPFIAGTIAQNFGYRPLFAVALVMALCALFMTLRFMRAAPEVAPAAIPSPAAD